MAGLPNPRDVTGRTDGDAPTHKGAQVGWPQPAASKTNRWSSNVPMYTLPSLTAAEEPIAPALIWPTHSGSHSLEPHPAASKAYKKWSAEATNTTPPAT